MTAIDRVGRFRGVPTEGVIRPTTNGFPQFIVSIKATEMFDEELGEWVGWEDFDQSITAYLVLFNATKPIFHYACVMRAFNWNGTDMGALQKDDYEGLQISFEVEENEYKGVVSLRANWVDTYDAEPRGGNMTPLDTGDIKALNAQYASMMVTKAPAAAAKAPAKAKAKGKLTRTKAQVKGPPKMPVAPLADTPVLDGEGAWTKINEALDGKTDSGTISAGWVKIVNEVAADSGKVDADFGTEQWNAVVDLLLEKLTV